MRRGQRRLRLQPRHHLGASANFSRVPRPDHGDDAGRGIRPRVGLGLPHDGDDRHPARPPGSSRRRAARNERRNSITPVGHNPQMGAARPLNLPGTAPSSPPCPSWPPARTTALPPASPTAGPYRPKAPSPRHESKRRTTNDRFTARLPLGASTAPHQIEGNNVNSDWWVYERDAALQTPVATPSTATTATKRTCVSSPTPA